jgi:pimeloyl-ACP methyl ester carboxylesterase
MKRSIRTALAAASVWFVTSVVGVSADEATLHIGNATVHKSGNGRQAVILIPGLGCGPFVWNDVAPRLAATMTVYTVTFDGFDGAPAAKGPYLQGFTQSVADLIASEKLDRPLLIGHSLGGHVAVRLAETLPNAVGAVLAVDALPLFPLPQAGETPAGRRSAAEQLRNGMIAASDADFAAQIRASSAYLVSDPANVDLVIAHELKADRATFAGAFAEMMLEDLTPDLGKIVAPITVVVPAAAPAQADANAAYYASLYGGVAHVRVVVVAPSKHFVMLDQPARFHAAVDAFVAENRAR